MFQAKKVTAPRATETINPAYASSEERAQYTEADDFSFVHFGGLKMSGPMEDVDLPALGTDFTIPIFILQGQEDLTAIPELARAYFDTIKAPHKQFYLVPGTGHEPSATELDMTLKVLTEQLRPWGLEKRTGYAGTQTFLHTMRSPEVRKSGGHICGLSPLPWRMTGHSEIDPATGRRSVSGLPTIHRESLYPLPAKHGEAALPPHAWPSMDET